MHGRKSRLQGILGQITAYAGYISSKLKISGRLSHLQIIVNLLARDETWCFFFIRSFLTKPIDSKLYLMMTQK